MTNKHATTKQSPQNHPLMMQKLLNSGLHNCSNATSCELGTEICHNNNVVGVGDMSNKIKMNNA